MGPRNPLRLALVWLTERLGIYREVRCPKCNWVLREVAWGSVVTVTFHKDCSYGEHPFSSGH